MPPCFRPARGKSFEPKSSSAPRCSSSRMLAVYLTAPAAASAVTNCARLQAIRASTSACRLSERARAQFDFAMNDSKKSVLKPSGKQAARAYKSQCDAHTRGVSPARVQASAEQPRQSEVQAARMRSCQCSSRASSMELPPNSAPGNQRHTP